jgi:DnaJ-class molecular chaperone
MKTHYDTLGVPKHATKKEIKSAFRKLSLETHPDVAANASTSNVKRFQQIAEAHRVLTNETERRIYDAEMMDPIRRELRKHGRGFRRHAAQGATEVQHPSFMHALFDGMGRPRNIALGLTVGIGTMMALQYTFGRRQEKMAKEPLMVEAWFNPATQQYEPPAPWDPTYKKLKPKIEYVPRQDVRQHD